MKSAKGGTGMSAAANRSVAGGPSPVGRLGWAVSDSLTMAGRNLVRYVRVPQLLVGATLQPIIFVVLFTYVFGGAIGGVIEAPGVSYIDYLLSGFFAQTVIFGAVQTGVGLAQDLQNGVVDRFKSLPMARSAVLAGRTLSDAVRNLFVVALMVGVGYIHGRVPLPERRARRLGRRGAGRPLRAGLLVDLGHLGSLHRGRRVGPGVGVRLGVPVGFRLLRVRARRDHAGLAQVLHRGQSHNGGGGRHAGPRLGRRFRGPRLAGPSLDFRHHRRLRPPRRVALPKDVLGET